MKTETYGFNTGAKRVGETVTIKWGLQNSSNWVTAYLMGQLLHIHLYVYFIPLD